MRNKGWGWIASVVLAVSGCQCLEPVAEVPSDGGRDGGADAGHLDAGGDAGFDAGLDAGPQPQCTTAAQCVGALPAQSLCNFSTDAGFSCIEQRCVFECTKGRACAFDAGPACLACTTPPETACKLSGCGATNMQGQVESSTTSCQVGFTDVMLVPTNGCQWTVTDATGAKGVMTHLGGAQYVGQFTGLGTCVGISLLGQVERVLFSCEGCQFVLRI